MARWAVDCASGSGWPDWLSFPLAGLFTRQIDPLNQPPGGTVPAYLLPLPPVKPSVASGGVASRAHRPPLLKTELTTQGKHI